MPLAQRIPEEQKAARADLAQNLRRHDLVDGRLRQVRDVVVLGHHEVVGQIVVEDGRLGCSAVQLDDHRAVDVQHVIEREARVGIRLDDDGTARLFEIPPGDVHEAATIWAAGDEQRDVIGLAAIVERPLQSSVVVRRDDQLRVVMARGAQLSGDVGEEAMNRARLDGLGLRPQRLAQRKASRAHEHLL
jgi:hypothetical protein